MEFDVLQQSEPAVRVKSLPSDVVNDVVVDDPVCIVSLQSMPSFTQ